MNLFDRLRPYPVLQRVIVNTKTDHTFRGILWRRRGAYLVLRQAELVKHKAEPESLTGEILIERENVDFLQVIRWP